MARCTMPGCAEFADRRELCTKHYTQQYRGRDPQPFINERERLLRIEKGTGDTGKSENSRNQLTAQQRGALGRSTAAAGETDEVDEVSATQERIVRMPYVRFLDPAHQRIKT